MAGGVARQWLALALASHGIIEIPVKSKLVHTYVEKLMLPQRARADLLHIAFAVSYEVDYLLTWNCAHLANGEVIRRLLEVNRILGRATPLILTPEELLYPVG